MTAPLYKSPNAKVKLLVSESFNLDNGAGTTVDRTMARFSKSLQLYAARIVYDDATTGTVAAGNMRVGTAVGGSEIVASTAYENAKAVGTATAMVLVIVAVPANTPIIVRHTGVAITQAGFAHCEIEYAVDDE
jgi:hypothetical protein